MKKSLTMSLVLAATSVFAQVIAGKVTEVNNRAETFTLATVGKPLTLAGLNLSLGAGGANTVSVSWTGNAGHTYKLCWKRSNQNGDACNHNKIVDIDASDSIVSISASTWSMVVNADCATAYHFKLKREGALTNDEKDYTTPPCCAVKCPAGGWFDGANCQVGQAPSGTTAFIWGGAYYYSPKPAAPGPRCPLAGSSYDGANCFVKQVPAGVQPFIWANHWYYKACP